MHGYNNLSSRVYNREGYSPSLLYTLAIICHGNNYYNQLANTSAVIDSDSKQSLH